LLADKKAPLIADAGAGAGFSGITAKILWPQAEFVLIDSLSKRCAFMEWVCAKLELSAIKAARLRLGQDKSGIQADAVLERAMGQLEDIAGACASVAAPGGYFIAYRSSPQDAGAQLSPLLENAAAPDLPLSYRLPDEEQFRHFAVFRRKALG
ncbi:MAG TPA: class I SAM-dependent methyltransferase, partial [Elusimicrobiales bacterium]|nr:class I SAM-dependent methyltransferase [Elusimicrobiales bacterium]